MVESGENPDGDVKPIQVDEDGNVYAVITDGTNFARLEQDDGQVLYNQQRIVVINLNYVWDSVNLRWERMTQP